MPDPLCELGDFERDFALGHPEMDRTHREFLELCRQVQEADTSTFPKRLRKLRDHTHEHFSKEEAFMSDTWFPAITPHTVEHKRILREMDRLLVLAEAGSSERAREWVQEYLPGWFQAHLGSLVICVVQDCRYFGEKTKA
jgi:hemerythrin-like metal-binding protein